ncbi:MAG: hypothetical protein Q7S74_01175 [Nanoarchaeota archaeon]|nr:hypothetical protein [Nanoarchaeota archaeon]
MSEDCFQEDLLNVQEVLNSMTSYFTLGHIEEERFTVTYAQDKFLMITMKRDGPLLERLVKAFSKVVGYNPLCKYTDLGGMKTYEWDKINPNERITDLTRAGKTDIVKFIRES